MLIENHIYVFDFFQIFQEIGAVEPLRRVACSTNKLASKFAAQALKTIGEDVPYKLTQQVPLWTVLDVQHWLQQVEHFHCNNWVFSPLFVGKNWD